MVYGITGIQAGRGPNGEPPVRREIDEWWFSKANIDINQRSLFIYALQEFQSRGLDPNQPDDLSYVGVAGIHGLPLQPWPRNSGQVKTKWYCAHRKETFPTWHTPYMLLFEQRLYEIMRELIPSLFDQSEQEEMILAANTWRLPFWDWAKKKPTWNPRNQEDPVNQQLDSGPGPNVPFLITQEKVEVRARQGSAITVPNPMYHFTLKIGQNFGQFGVSSENLKEKYIGKCRVTSRNPETRDEGHKLFESDYVNGENQNYLRITGQIRGKNVFDEHDFAPNSLPEAVYRLFNFTQNDQNKPTITYPQFAALNYNVGQEPRAYPSLEAIHDTMHDLAGGNGYLGDPSTAGFDPLFWLHHCNVDRLLAIWHQLYSGSYKEWLSSKKNPDDGPDTKLLPFSGPDGEFYTSRTCSYKHDQFCYTYPELQKEPNENDAAYIKRTHDRLAKLYRTTPQASLLLPENAAVAKSQMLAMTARNLAVENWPAELVAMASPSAQADSDKPLAEIRAMSFGEPPELTWQNNDYVVDIVYERFALGGNSYSITVFLGDVPDTNNFNFADHYTALGLVYNFSSPAELLGVDETGCASCKQQQQDRSLSTGQVILTDYLIERIHSGEPQRGLTLRSLDRDEVVDYLKKNLHWRITDLHGNIILKEDPRMELLKVSVAMARATHSSDASRPTQFTPYEVLWEVTSGRLAGASEGEI